VKEIGDRQYPSFTGRQMTVSIPATKLFIQLFHQVFGCFNYCDQIYNLKFFIVVETVTVIRTVTLRKTVECSDRSQNDQRQKIFGRFDCCCYKVAGIQLDWIA